MSQTSLYMYPNGILLYIQSMWIFRWRSWLYQADWCTSLSEMKHFISVIFNIGSLEGFLLSCLCFTRSSSFEELLGTHQLVPNSIWNKPNVVISAYLRGTWLDGLEVWENLLVDVGRYFCWYRTCVFLVFFLVYWYVKDKYSYCL